MAEKALTERVSDLLREISPAHAVDFEDGYEGKDNSIEDLNKHFRLELASFQ